MPEDTRHGSLKLTLTHGRTSKPITVDLEAFFDFSFWLAEELQDLIAQQRQTARDLDSSRLGRRHLAGPRNAR